MLKILYALQKDYSAKEQAIRFFDIIKKIDKISFKIICYRDFCPLNYADYLLDSIDQPHRGKHKDLDVSRTLLDSYESFISGYKPDLIIVDSEYYTANIAYKLKIPLWNFSASSLKLILSIGTIRDSGISTYMRIIKNEKHSVVFDLADRNFVNSHIFDALGEPVFIEKAEHVKPYYVLGTKRSSMLKHDFIGASLRDDVNLIKNLQNLNDCVYFTKSLGSYNNLITKSFDDEDYGSNLLSSNALICLGEPSILADAFYNRIFANVVIDRKNVDSVVFGGISQLCHTGKLIGMNDFDEIESRAVFVPPQKERKQFHEYILEIL